MLMLLIRLFAILMLSTFEQITFFWNQGVYTPTLKKTSGGTRSQKVWEPLG